VSQILDFEPRGQASVLESWLELEQAVLDALPVGVYLCDAGGLLLRVNRKAVELWGRTPRLFDPVNRFCGCFRVESLDGQFIAPDQTPMARADSTARAPKVRKPSCRIPTESIGLRAST
jgi:PAS domain-containing protein